MSRDQKTRALVERVLRDPESEDSRTSAVIALRYLFEDGLLPWQGPRESVVVEKVEVTWVSVGEAISPHSVVVGGQVFRRIPALSYGARCILCGGIIHKGETAYLGRDSATIHMKCALERHTG